MGLGHLQKTTYSSLSNLTIKQPPQGTRFAASGEPKHVLSKTLGSVTFKLNFAIFVLEAVKQHKYNPLNTGKPVEILGRKATGLRTNV